MGSFFNSNAKRAHKTKESMNNYYQQALNYLNGSTKKEPEYFAEVLRCYARPKNAKECQKQALYYATTMQLKEYASYSTPLPPGSEGLCRLFAWISRVFSGKWNRHHGDAVVNKLNPLFHETYGSQSVELSSLEQLMRFLNSVVLYNPEGSLACIKKEANERFNDIDGNDKDDSDEPCLAVATAP